MATAERTHVIVLTHNGRDILERNLANIRLACIDHHLTVVDNESTDGTPAWLAAHHPAVEVVRSPNQYLFSLNAVVRASPYRRVVLLNDDLTVEPDFIAPLLTHFDDPRVFSVGSKVLEASRDAVLLARVEAQFSYGVLTPKHFLEQLLEPDSLGPQPTLYTPGGASAYDRDKFVALGGFDRVYRPIYVEDVDICYRAWRRGWQCIYEPRSVVYAERGTTMKKQITRTRRAQLELRNHLLLTWKNVSDRRILWSSVRTGLWYLRRGERWQARAVLGALLRLPEALLKRSRDARGIPDRVLCSQVWE